MNYHYFALYTDAREGDEGVTDTMARTAAHEFGHFLTLSTRAKNYSAVPTGHDDELGVYDTNLKSYGTGKYPPIKPSKTVQALMRSGDQIKGTPRPPGRWIRHEDWEAANIEAWKVKP